jgi:hypothetical protein
MTPGAVVDTRLTSYLDFQEFEALPCGCIAGAYVARPWGLPLVALEVKGPYCPFSEHRTSQLLQLGDPVGYEEEEETEQAGLPQAW